MKYYLAIFGILLLLVSCENSLTQQNTTDQGNPANTGSVTIALRKPDIQVPLDQTQQSSPVSASRLLIAEVQTVEVIICPDSVASAITDTTTVPASSTLDTIKANASTVTRILSFGGGSEIVETINGIPPGNTTVIVGTFDSSTVNWMSNVVSFVVSKNNAFVSGSNDLALSLRLNTSRYEMIYYWGSLNGYTFDMYRDTSWSYQSPSNAPYTIIFGGGNIKAGINHIYLQQGLPDPVDGANQHYIDPLTIGFYDHEGKAIPATYDTSTATPFWILNIPTIAQQSDYRIFITSIVDAGFIPADQALLFEYTADAGYMAASVEPYNMGSLSFTLQFNV